MISRMIVWLLRKFSYVRGLESDLQKSQKQFTDYVSGNTNLHSIAMENGRLSMTASCEVAGEIAEQMMVVLDEAKAINYVELLFKSSGCVDDIPVYIMRPGGKTPHQMRLEAEALVTRLKEELDTLRKGV